MRYTFSIKDVKIDDELTRYIEAEALYRNDIIPYPAIARYFKSEISKPFLDTGAMFLLSDRGRLKMGVESNALGGSFIAKSVFDQWHQEHPDWKVNVTIDYNSEIIRFEQ
jgi:hypothetical protein